MLNSCQKNLVVHRWPHFRRIPYYLNVDRLPSPSGPHEQARLLVLHQHLHEVRVANSVHSGNDDGVEQGISRDRRGVDESITPWHPSSHIFLHELVVVHVALVWKGNWEGLFWGIACLEQVVLGPANIEVTSYSQATFELMTFLYYGTCSCFEIVIEE